MMAKLTLAIVTQRPPCMFCCSCKLLFLFSDEGPSINFPCLKNVAKVKHHLFQLFSTLFWFNFYGQLVNSRMP